MAQLPDRRPVYDGKQLSNTPGMPSTPPAKPQGKAPVVIPKGVQKLSDTLSSPMNSEDSCCG